MTLKKQDYESSEKRPAEKGTQPVQKEAGEAGEIACRCKEVSKKTFPELLRLMIKDIAFWKNENEHK